MIWRQIRIDQETHDTLRKEAGARDRSMASYLRQLMGAIRKSKRTGTPIDFKSWGSE